MSFKSTDVFTLDMLREAADRLPRIKPEEIALSEATLSSLRKIAISHPMTMPTTLTGLPLVVDVTMPDGIFEIRPLGSLSYALRKLMEK